MYKRYRGNSGLVERVEERREPPPAVEATPLPLAPPGPPPPSPVLRPRLLSELLGRFLPGGMEPPESEDLILLLILYLLYRESGDTELLLMMGALLLPV